MRGGLSFEKLLGGRLDFTDILDNLSQLMVWAQNAVGDFESPPEKVGLFRTVILSDKFYDQLELVD